MAFQSALAGLGLAADLVKHAAGLPVPASTSTRINLLRPLAPMLADPRAPEPRAGAFAATGISSTCIDANMPFTCDAQLLIPKPSIDLADYATRLR